MKHVPHILFGLMGLLSSISIYSQNTIVECLYEYRHIVDTTAVKISTCGLVESGDSTKIAKERLILNCGGSVSLFYSYDQMVVDSVLAANKLAGKPALTGYNGRMGSPRRIYKDFGSSNLTVFDKIGMDWFKVIEEFPEFGWRLCGEWKEICGYKVHKATCKFRGRDYEAWYAPDIPISDGPWKFRGLPGLVLEVYDIPCQYYYCLIGIKMKETSLEYPDVNTIDTSMKKFNDTKRRYLENPALYMSSTYGGPVSFVDRNGNPIDPETMSEKLKYDFQEIDFK